MILISYLNDRSTRFVSTLLFFLLFCLPYVETKGQEKLEREYRISVDKVPEKAKDFVKNTYSNTKVKWYKEESFSGFSVEAKMKWKGQLHSVEFDTLGNLQDVEVAIDFNDISKANQERVHAYLKANFQHYKISKTQLQLKGPPAQLQRIITNENQAQLEKFAINYELVVKGRHHEDNIVHFYELLVDRKGAVINRSKIVERAVNHLIF
ncbi:hypothetical protein [Olivibacter sp. XZL3]|uniref:hypothetical protein n=1 Tax=Olivibacter sp. XZL3 TaxID=1735116 RepID=UPI001065AAFB|nr:hypothetical protein [Olivibacter sp. XZL3]